jgi:hypothetical protein
LSIRNPNHITCPLNLRIQAVYFIFFYHNVQTPILHFFSSPYMQFVQRGLNSHSEHNNPSMNDRSSVTGGFWSFGEFRFTPI